ncbi:MAG TPA: MBOAT family protein [Casimicrobiaceae bacterium]|jgi:D-alanyl-lipoteichoic acid acyltransferase DltB (MBOAT superfamily)
MLFNSYEYLVYFLPAALAGYFLLSRRPAWAIAWLVAASLFFYAWWKPSDLPLIVASIVGNFVLGRALQRAPASNRWLLPLAIGANLAALAVYKYADFALQTFATATGRNVPLLHIALPLGISFFTFTQIAFLVDCRRGKASEPSLNQYGLFVSFFPHLLSGPILHHSEMMPQFASPSNKRPRSANLSAGLFLLCIGLAKKVLIADTLAPIADAGFAHPAQQSMPGAWLSVLAYTLQIYFDFSGYTDMALGSALMFNIRLPINFDSPYRALDLRDFWRRWHITLSRFLREYLYIPLGGNRRGEARTLANLLVTFALGGLWHGAAWTFVAWGVLHGVGLVTLRLWRRLGLELPNLLAWAITMLFVMCTWVFFRAASLGDAVAMLRAMVGLSGVPAAGTGWIPAVGALTGAWPAIVAIGAFVLCLRARNSNRMVAEFRPRLVNGAAVTAGLVAALLQLGNVSPFIYFNF